MGDLLEQSSRVVLSPRVLRELSTPSSTLRAVVERSDEAVVVYAGGELDACNESVWRRLLSEAADAAVPASVLIVDLSALRFVSCGALEVLINQCYACRRLGVQMRLVTEQNVIKRVVEAFSLGDILPVHTSMGTAVGGDGALLSTDGGQPDPGSAHTRVASIARQVDADVSTLIHSVPLALEHSRRLSRFVAVLRRWRRPRRVEYAVAAALPESGSLAG